MDFSAVYVRLHMDPAVASAVLEGLPKRVEKALDKRVGGRAKYCEVIAKPWRASGTKMLSRSRTRGRQGEP